MKNYSKFIWLCLLTIVLFFKTVHAQTDKRIKNYLPHMTWEEVEAALKITDMVIIPVGSIEQHGKHLPLGSDIIQAEEISKRIAEKTGALVAPGVLAGLSEHHMGFPGSITLSPETFEAVVFECAKSLIQHGFRKIVFYNGHGGNTTSLSKVIHNINQGTPAIAINLAQVSKPEQKSPYESIEFDWHAGVNETSSMLYLAGGLVQMDKAENPVIKITPYAKEITKNMDAKNADLILHSYYFSPERSGKNTTARDMTNNGVFTTGDLKTATEERGKLRAESFTEAAAEFLNSWNK